MNEELINLAQVVANLQGKINKREKRIDELVRQCNELHSNRENASQFLKDACEVFDNFLKHLSKMDYIPTERIESNRATWTNDFCNELFIRIGTPQCSSRPTP